MKLFTLLFCLQSLLIFYPNQALAEENVFPNCQTGYTPNNDLKKCVMEEHVKDVAAQTAECERLHSNNEEERRKCLLKNAYNSEGGSGAGVTNAMVRCQKKHPDDEAKRNQCIADSKADGGVWGTNQGAIQSWAWTNRAGQLLWSLTNIKFLSAKGKCQTNSHIAMGMAGLVSAAAEVYSYISHHRQSKKLLEDYKNRMKDIESTTAQQDAFNFLAEEQDIKEKADRWRKRGYIAAASVYGIAAIIAAVEWVNSKKGGQPALCEKQQLNRATFLKGGIYRIMAVAGGIVPAVIPILGKPKTIEDEMNLDANIDPKKFEHFLDQQLEEAVAIDYRQRELQNFYFNQSISSQSANEYNEQQAEWNLIVKNSLSRIFRQLKSELLINEAHSAVAEPDGLLDKMDTPSNRFYASIVMAGLGTSNAVIADKQADIAKTRAEKYREIANKLSELNDEDLGICKEADKDDPSKPECYCYTDNAPNPSRLKSEVCADLFKPKIIQKKPTDYSSNKPGSGVGCVAINGVFDQACKCREMKGKNGENACMKMPTSLDVNGMIGPNSFATSAIKESNGIFSGNTSGGNMSDGNLSGLSNAMTNLKKKVNADLAKSGQSPIDYKKIQNGFLRSGMNDLKLMAPAALNENSATASSGLASILNQKDMDKIEKAALDNGIKESDITFKPLSAAAKAKEEAKFDLGNLEGGNNGPEQLEMNGGMVMAKNFDYKNNDISGNSTESLFKMISNRYIVTGLQRLFEEIPAKNEAKPAPKK